MKETLNTFSEGLVKDYNEMVSPKNVMSNCLNGTLITYNGNEFTLQNDMGNVKLDNVKLPEGYIPVGIAEHGGIVYVAAYNPNTKKGQIGSYPSPRQLWDEDSEGNNYTVELSPEHFRKKVVFTFIQPAPYIYKLVVDSVRYDLFEYNGEKRRFSVGDSWNINILDSTYSGSWLKTLMDEGIITMEFNLISNSGQTEVLDKLSYTDNQGLQLIKNNENLRYQILNSKSNGTLQLVVNFNTFQTFNLVRKYMISDNGIQAKFWAADFASEQENDRYRGLLYYSQSGSPQEGSEVTLSQGKDGIISYDFTPICKYVGAVEKFRKQGKIDVNKLQKTGYLLDNWSFFVGSYSTTIYWSFDYLDINDTPLERMRIKYYNAVDLLRREKRYEIVNLDYESYIGDFELILKNLTLNSIYLVEFYITKQGNENEELVGTKVLYNAPFFNSWTSEQLKTTERPEILVRTNYRSATKVSAPTIRVKKNKDWNPNEDISVEIEPTQPEYLVRNPSGEYAFYNQKEATYNITPSVEIYAEELEYDGDTYKLSDIVGIFTDATIDTASNVEINETPLYSVNNQEMQDILSGKIAPSYITQEEQLSVTAIRGIYASQSEEATKTYYVEQLLPVYVKGEEDKLFSFKEKAGQLTCAAGKKGQINSNAIVSYASGTTSNNGDKAGDGDEPGLDTALNDMGGQSFGIMAGFGGKDASLRVTNYPSTLGPNGRIYAWATDAIDEVDNNDNFIMATCKCVNGHNYFINLASRKNEETTYGRRNVVYLLKCMLSQMLIAKRSKVTEQVIAPNPNKCVYHEDFDTNITITYENSLDLDPIIDNYAYSEVFNEIKKQLAEDTESYMFLPIFTNGGQTTIQETLQVGEEANISSDILPYYNISLSAITLSGEAYQGQIAQMKADYVFDINNATTISPFGAYGDELNPTYLRSHIFLGDVISIDSTGTCELRTNSDGSYKVRAIAKIYGSLTPTDFHNLQYWNSNNISEQAFITQRDSTALDDVFITSLKYEGKEGVPIDEDYYNTLLLKYDNNRRSEGKWVQGGDTHAPDTIGFVFANTSMWKYSNVVV